MQEKKLDIDFSVDQKNAAAESVVNTKHAQVLAEQAIAFLETTAPHAYAHLRHALASQSTELVLSIPTHLIRRSAYANL